MIHFNVRWGSKDGKTLDEIEEILRKSSSGKTWYSDPVAEEHEAAMAWHVTTEQWDELPAEHQGRMLETFRMKRTKAAWETHVAQSEK